MWIDGPIIETYWNHLICTTSLQTYVRNRSFINRNVTLVLSEICTIITMWNNNSWLFCWNFNHEVFFMKGSGSFSRKSDISSLKEAARALLLKFEGSSCWYWVTGGRGLLLWACGLTFGFICLTCGSYFVVECFSSCLTGRFWRGFS